MDNQTDFDALITFVRIMAESDARPRKYSGRAMYGRECLAFTTDKPIAAIALGILETVREAAWLDLGEQFMDDVTNILSDLFMHVRTDDLGRGTVVYFPGTAWNPEWDAFVGDN